MNRTIYVDLTTAFEDVGRHAHGTMRVERGLVAAFARMGRPDIAFCRYRPLTGSYVAVTAEDALRIATAPSRFEARRGARAAWRRHPLLEQGKRVEAWFRHRVRDRLRLAVIERLRKGKPHPVTEQKPAARSGAGEQDFAAGSILLISGEAQRHDFPVLARLKRSRDLALVFVHYDLLRVLPNDDPRLRQPSAMDLPVTDFIAREAALLLAISHYSARVLAESLSERELTSPPIAVVRLGTDLTEAGGQVAVPGLSPGEFVLTVGEVGWRKNTALLVSVWRDLIRRGVDRKVRLAVAGAVAAAGTPLVEEVRRDPALAEAIRFLPNAADGELRWLYANCRFTAFPSRREGFGLPVAESLAFGKVCVASNAMAIPEASQGVGIHLDPEDTPAWTRVIEQFINDDEALRREEAVTAARYVSVNWKQTAEDVLAAVEARLPRPSSSR